METDNFERFNFSNALAFLATSELFVRPICSRVFNCEKLTVL